MNYNQKVVIETPVSGGTDDYGKTIEDTWTTFLTTGANIRSTSSKVTTTKGMDIDETVFTLEVRSTAKSHTTPDNSRITLPNGEIIHTKHVDVYGQKDKGLILITAVRR